MESNKKDQNFIKERASLLGIKGTLPENVNLGNDIAVDIRYEISIMNVADNGIVTSRHQNFLTGLDHLHREEYDYTITVGIRGTTDDSGIALFKLSEVCLFSDVYFYEPIVSTVTSKNSPASFVVEDRQIDSNTDIEYKVLSFDLDGNPKAFSRFDMISIFPGNYQIS